MNRGNLILKKPRMKDVHHKHMHVSKDLCASQHCEESSHTVSGKSTCLGVFLRCLYTNACGTLNKQEELVCSCTAVVSLV